jgi:hypothetical protein
MVFFFEKTRLRAFTCAGGTNQNDIHYAVP